MDDFPGLLARDFGFRPQGKSAPMSASKTTTGNASGGGTLDFGIQSGNHNRSSSFSSNRANPGLNSNSMSSSILDDHDELFGSSATKKTQDLGGLGAYSDVFGGPPKYSNPSDSRGGGASSFDYDSIFQGSNDLGAKTSSLPVFDKPVYDEDIFDGVPGLKSSSSVQYNDVFSSISLPPKNNAAYDDLLGNLGKAEPELKTSSRKKSTEVEKDVPGFDGLIPGFGGSSPPTNKASSETSRPQQSTVPPTNSTSSTIEDPFVVLETASAPSYSSSGLFSDPLEQISKLGNSGSTKVDGSSVSDGVFDDINPLEGLGKSFPVFSSEMNSRRKDGNPIGSGYTSSGKESTGEPSIKTSENHSQKKAPVDSFRESHQTLFDMATGSSDSHKAVGRTGSRPSHVNSSETNSDTSPRSEENMEAVDDLWLTVSEIPLFTQPTSAPPPSRPPPPRPALASKGNKAYFGSETANKKVNEFTSFPHSTRNFQSPKAVHDAVKSSTVSPMDELENFAMGRNQNNIDQHTDVISSEEEEETNSAAAASAAAMKEAMDRAEAKFKHAKEVRERENAKAAKSREATQQEKDQKAMQDAQEREFREKQGRLDHEWQQKEIEEKEREQRRLERERERAREIDREREKARQAVERATREARERAAAEARLKAERAAVEKVNAGARERAERAAVQRAQAEARERAAAEARERAERAAAEARERANAEAREKEARERAAVARAEAEARRRAERAAVERAAAEARERAAAAARENQQKNERAASAARENQQRNENDLESFFGMDNRPSSAPRPRANTSDPMFDTQFQNRGGSDGPRRTSVGTPSSMRKASSTTNIVDDLTSIFGAAPSSGSFQEVEGENEERRRARLERHQRTQERAAKALAEKNERDLQAQRDQAERHRIAETLDAEIKRWAAGKEGNLRALLSTMQYVLWPACGWQPVSLTDLITSTSVKKVYRKATLCIHPDKVQQKGANLQQKYIAEKVFDLLKEAWNKFNSEELF